MGTYGNRSFSSSVLFKYPVACDLLVSYCKSSVEAGVNDKDKVSRDHLRLLREFYYHLGKFQEAGNFSLGQAYGSTTLAS